MKHEDKFSLAILLLSYSLFPIQNSQIPAAYSAPATSIKKAPATAPKQAPAKPAATAPNLPSGKLSPAGQVLVAAYDRYAAQVQSLILDKWLVPDGKNKVILSIIIEPDGTTSGLSLVSNPKNETAEQAAKTAFGAAEPLAPLPNNSPPVKLILTFVSQAEPHGESNAQLGVRIEPQQNLAAPAGGLPPLPAPPSE